MDKRYEDLLKAAVTASKNSHSPYSGFSVGAALLCKNGKVYCGCNIENASYPLGVCAERTAIFSAVAKGEREFEAIAIVGSSDDDFTKPCFPCGSCRQVMSEFCSDDFKIVLSDKVLTLGELLPYAFRL